MAMIKWKNAGSGLSVAAGEFEFSLATGFEPGSGHLRLGAQQFAQLESPGEVAVTANFEGERAPTTITVKDLYITDYTSKTDESGSTIYSVSLTDRRERWKRFGEITLRANCTLADGTLDPASLNAGSRYSWRDLVLRCIDAIGESDRLVLADALPANPVTPRNVRWTGKNAAEALEEMLAPAGYTVALHYDGSLEIIKKGFLRNQTVSAGYGPNRRTGRLFNLVPDSVQVVGAPVLNETSVELEPCALDTDASIKALPDISYLRGLDLGRELATGFASLAASPEAQAAARLSVGHYFRIPKTGLYPDESESSGRALVPVLPSTGPGTAPSLEGAWFERADKRRYRNVGGPGELKPFAKGFSVIDPSRGLVYTRRICAILSDTEIDALPSVPETGMLRAEIVPPKLAFRHYMREPGGAPKHWRYRVGTGGAVETVSRPDFRLLCRDGTPDPAVLADLRARAAEIAEARTSVPGAIDVETGTYAGVHPLKCDGILERITWAADHAGALTSYSYGPPVQALTARPEAGSDPQYPGPAAGALVPAGSELRLTNANKHGPIVIRSSDERRLALASSNRRDDTEDNLFAQLEEFDETLQEPTLSRLAPPERHNWLYRDHSPAPNPSPDSQDIVWALQLISDDKYMIETALNRSTAVLRLCDENSGDLDDIWRVRAVPSAGDVAADMEQRDDETRVKLISTSQAFRLMWLVNTAIGGEGGWITDVPPQGLALGAPTDEKDVSPPRRIGQIGSIVILTDDDEIVQTRDGDLFTYANIRHDAHFHKSDQRDGRIHFKDTAPGTRPAGGTPLLGEMVCDPAVKNTETGLGKESGQWCPQVAIPYLDGPSDDTAPEYFGQGGG